MTAVATVAPPTAIGPIVLLLHATVLIALVGPADRAAPASLAANPTRASVPSIATTGGDEGAAGDPALSALDEHQGERAAAAETAKAPVAPLATAPTAGAATAVALTGNASPTTTAPTTAPAAVLT
jgi:hypothetical protein